MKILAISFLFLINVCAAFGQVAGGSGGSITSTSQAWSRTANGKMSGSASFPAQRFIPPAVLGAPYSAEQVQKHVQTLNDGTHITQTQMHTKQFRDSQGRTRTERPLIPMRGDAQDSPMVVEITDPLAGVRYTLDVQNKIAHRVAVQSPGGASGGIISNTPWFVANGPVPPPPPSASAVTTRTGTMQAVITQASPATVRALRDTTEEKLPPQTIEGVLAEGVRHTTVIPEGAEGNDRPFSITSETWTSPDLKMVVLSKNNDPRNGESIMKLINISRNEPDPLLFQPPPDYQIVDETAPFTIRYNQ